MSAPSPGTREDTWELSVNAAAIQAGIVKPTITVPRDVHGLVAALRRHFTADELDRFATALLDRSAPEQP